MILPVVAAEAVRIQHLPEVLPEAVAENSRRDVRIRNTGQFNSEKREAISQILGNWLLFLNSVIICLHPQNISWTHHKNTAVPSRIPGSNPVSEVLFSVIHLLSQYLQYKVSDRDYESWSGMNSAGEIGPNFLEAKRISTSAPVSLSCRISMTGWKIIENPRKPWFTAEWSSFVISRIRKKFWYSSSWNI